MAIVDVEDSFPKGVQESTTDSKLTSANQINRLVKRAVLLQVYEISETNVSSAQDEWVQIVPNDIQFGKEQKSRPVLVVETQVSDSDTESGSDDISVTSISSLETVQTISQSFVEFQSQWIEDPIIRQWRQPEHRVYDVLTAVEKLHREWRSLRIGPFNPFTDNIWLQIGRTLADVGLPWHNNQINLPDEIDTSWPFHFKSFESHVMQTKGSRVGDPNPSGYVCNSGEANCYGIRALQQELRERCPDHKPLLVYDWIDYDVVKSAERLFGLESYRVDLLQDAEALLDNLKSATTNGTRPIIFAATLANKAGRHDALDPICKISESLPLILHIDAARNFDYVTTMGDQERQALGIEKLRLGLTGFGDSIRTMDGSVLAGTIVAGGANHVSPAPVVALKPSALGTTHAKVAYTRASDSTLAGSRDALAPLWVALQEIRFGESGFRRVYQYCSSMRRALVQALRSSGVNVYASEYTLDVLINGCTKQQTQSLLHLGGRSTDQKNVLITIQPSITFADLDSLTQVFSMSSQSRIDRAWLPVPQDFANSFPVPQDIIDQLQATVQSWKTVTQYAAGYPFHMGSYSALGPVIGHFLDVNIPDAWIQARAQEILTRRMRLFGLKRSQDRRRFKGTFTNGSTMGNRIGIHAALMQYPNAHVYFSSETHYSVAKTARDCDSLASRWSERSCRYAEIPCEEDGCISVKELVQQALHDQAECRKNGETFRLILFLNMGTTFVGARDGIANIRKCLAEVNIEISYIHMDGALEFGFCDCGIALGPPDVMELNGKPVVQGVTLSHHKAMGNMVSGEVLCYSPETELASLGSEVDPRAIFETWLYAQVYTDADLVQLFRYCENNASRLEVGLNNIEVVTKRNRDSTIVVMERPPAWITEEFSLRPQEYWVHFIAMPHISPNVVDTFIQRIAWVDQRCEAAFHNITPRLNSIMNKVLKLKRTQCRSQLAEKVRLLAQSLTKPAGNYHESVDMAIKASLRGAMSVVAVDEDDVPHAVFLMESTRDRQIRIGPVIARSMSGDSEKTLLRLAQRLVANLAQELHVKTVTDSLSLKFLPLS